MSDIYILGVKYELETFIPTKDDEAGYTHFDDKKIEINKSLSEYMTRGTLIHEIVHAYMHESGLDEVTTQWVHDESLMVWLQIQLPKIIKTLEECEKLL